MTKAVKRYAVYFFKKNDPEYRQKIDNKVNRIKMIRQLLEKCDYQESYVWRSEEFLNSVPPVDGEHALLVKRVIKFFRYGRTKKLNKYENNA